MPSPAERSVGRFRVATEDLEEAVVITIAGEVDAANVHAVRTALEKAIEPARPHFVVDLRRVVYIDSMGITVLAQCFDHARGQGIAVAAICGERMAELLESLGLDAEVAIVRSVDQALAIAGSPEPPGSAPGASYRATLRAARELIEGGGVPPDDDELIRLRRALEEAPPPTRD